jgi:hypothetical protein
MDAYNADTASKSKQFIDVMADVINSKPAVSTDKMDNENGFKLWQDLGFLLIGDSKFTYDEQYAQFTLWAISKAPMFGNWDSYKLTEQTPKAEKLYPLIKLNQDP